MTGVCCHDPHADTETEEALADCHGDDGPVYARQVTLHTRKLHLDPITRTGFHQPSDCKYNQQHDRHWHRELHKLAQLLRTFNRSDPTNQHGDESL